MRCFVAFAASLVSTLAAAAPGPDRQPWMGPPLSATPSEIARAARAVPTPDGADRQVLLDERVYRFAPDGSLDVQQHQLFRVLTSAGIAAGPGIDVPWQPWTQTRPEIRARVIASDGSVHLLETATIEDIGASQGGSLYGDARVLRAPYPALSVGAIVELAVTLHDSSVASPAASLHSELLAGALPTELRRVVIDAPTALPLRYAVHGLAPIRQQRRQAAGRTILTFEAGPQPAMEIPPQDAPLDEVVPFVSFSVGGSWRDVARAYAQLAEAELAKTGRAELERIARAALGATPVSDQRKTAEALLTFVRREVRYIGIEFGKSSIVPHEPLQTLQRKYGDCKDQALLLVGLLRAVGIPAHVALLHASNGPDVEEALPGLNAFNHAIVHIEGAAPQWIDSTSEFARVNELPVPDQGRLALVASVDARGLVRTPTAPPGSNRTIETREIFLAERGRARVIERWEAYGAFDREWRSALAKIDAARARETLARAAAEAMGGQETARIELSDVNKLEVPFRVEIEVKESLLAFTDETGAKVTLPLHEIVGQLPSWTHTADGERPRTVDVVVNETAEYQWLTRVTPPAGLAVAGLPKDEVIPLGPLRLREHFAVDKSGVVLADLRVDITKGRVSAADVEATRAACRALEKREPPVLKLADIGRAQLAEGRVREALVEFRRRAALHPNEALHHLELADALLQVGLGEAARAEAARAVALEPTNTDALLMQHWVLIHDLIGRLWGKGYDRAGAETALRRLLQLDPTYAAAHGDMALWLEYDADGRRYASAATATQAIREYRSIEKEQRAQLGWEFNDLYVLLYFARWQELEEATRGSTTSVERAKFRLAALAMRSGVASALAEADAMPSDIREAAVREAAEALLQCRCYPQAARLFERASHEPSAPPWVAARNDVVRRLHRLEDAPIDARDPAAPVFRFYVEFLREYDDATLLARLRAITSADAAELGAGDAAWLVHVRRSWRNQELPLDVIRDAVLSIGSADKEGDDHVGYRIRFTKPFGAGVDTKFVVREHGQYRLLTASPPGDDTRPLGRRALAALEAHDTAAARRWLDWASDFFRNGDPSDHNVTAPFAQVWSAGAGGSPEVMRIAALMLLAGRVEADNRVALDGLRRARAALPPGVPAAAVDLEMARLQLALGDTAGALALADGAGGSGARAWFAVRRAALSRLARWGDLRQAAEAQLKASPDDPAALRALAQADEAEQHWDSFEAHMRALVASGHADASDYNKLAWDALFRGGAGERALDDARRANEMSQRRVSAELHTLASVEAELGHSRDAYMTLLQAIDSGIGEPRENDFYVLGRIAESMGLPDAALIEYRKVLAPKVSDTANPFSTRELARRRVQALTPAAMSH